LFSDGGIWRCREYAFNLKFYGESLKIFEKLTPGNAQKWLFSDGGIWRCREYAFNLKFYGESLKIFEKLTPGNQKRRPAVIVVVMVNVIMKN
jgi:hypothetical protein